MKGTINQEGRIIVATYASNIELSTYTTILTDIKGQVNPDKGMGITSYITYL